MSTPSPGKQPVPASIRPSDVPKAFVVGAVVALVAFVVHISYEQSSLTPTRSTCSYTDVAALGAAIAIGACVVIGWIQRRQAHPARRLAVPLMAACSAVLLAFAVVHVLRGLGTVGGPCH